MSVHFSERDKGDRFPQRLEEVVHRYELLGALSSTEITRRQAKALQMLLEREGLKLPVALVRVTGIRIYRNACPDDRTASSTHGLILSAQQSELLEAVPAECC
jgi:hypothetical protein